MKRFRFTLLCLVVVSIACSMQVPAEMTPVVSTATRLVAVETTTLPLGKTELETAIVTAYQSLHVRAARGTAAVVIDYLYHGDTVTLTGQCDQGWAEIVWEDAPSGTAWVNSDFLSKNKCSDGG